MGTDRFTGPLAAALAPALRRTTLADALRAADHALPVAPATDRSVWEPRTGVVHPTAGAVVARARADLGTPWPQPLASTAARLHRDGDRDTHEQLVFARQHRLSRAVLAAATTLEDRWVDEAADGIWQLCEQSSWCWPAHDDTRAVHGAVLPTVTDPYLDLGAGEAVGQLAWADHVLGALLDERYPGLRGRVRHEARTRVIEPFLRRRDWHWLGLDGRVHNWNPWIHGNVLVAALRLLDGPDDATTRLRTVELCVEGIDRYVASLPDDGAIDEGYGYWWNGACRALEALDLLRHATGGALDALAPGVVPPALRETVAFPHRMHLGGDWYLSVADAQARPTDVHPWHALHRAARAVGDADAAAYAVSRLASGPGAAAAPAAQAEAGLGRLLRGLTDTAWRDALAAGATAPLPRTAWWASTQVLLVRPEAGTPAGLTLAVKGGHNGEAHNHNDVGSVVVASDGVPVIVDAGRPTYTAQTFGPDRYDLWTMQSSWHSVPQVAGVAQGAGHEFAARDVELVGPADDATGLALDLAGTYPHEGLRSWRRTARLERVGDVARAVVDDAWDLDTPDDGGTTVRFLLAGDVDLDTARAVVRPLDGAPPVELHWPAEVPASLIRRELDDPMLSGVWGARLTRLDLDVTGRTALRVVVSMADPTPKETP
ncbi:heparinase II/III-family protein [Isoptericola sp. S6320L]|uniref:heparinase II/III domain-containing protein n=1 Tax=Isoptericola sp. S6320L TaxID=2926411 RepID=UPI001FF2FB3C|nr:heparinase II/III family protein [Isoptericola sp. S6320L]MCK0117778.1 heparinase II/III-family protein [Isoptericola sp. S6320L]